MLNNPSNEASCRTLNLNQNLFLYFQVIICKLCQINQWKVHITSRMQHFINFFFLQKSSFLFQTKQDPCMQRQCSLFFSDLWNAGKLGACSWFERFLCFYLINHSRFWIVSMERKNIPCFCFVNGEDRFVFYLDKQNNKVTYHNCADWKLLQL